MLMLCWVVCRLLLGRALLDNLLRVVFAGRVLSVLLGRIRLMSGLWLLCDMGMRLLILVRLMCRIW